jgi:hypothetical protein
MSDTTSDTTYTWTSGNMLHLETCEHFDEDKPPRPATKAELRDLPTCSTCSGRPAVRKAATSRKAPTIATDRFTCPRCFVSHPLAMRTDSGECRACAD